MPVPDSPAERRVLDVRQDAKADAADRDTLEEAFKAFDELCDALADAPKSKRPRRLVCYGCDAWAKTAVKLAKRIPWVRNDISTWMQNHLFYIDWRAHDAARDDLAELGA